MLELAYSAGLRVGEWITISVKDVLFDEGVVRVFGKGAKERLVPVGRKAIGAVAIYIRELRPRLERGGGKGTLFLNARGAPLSRMGAWKMLRKVRGNGRAHETRVASHTTPLLRDPSLGRWWPTCVRCKKCLGTPISRRRRFIPILIESTYAMSIDNFIRATMLVPRARGVTC